MKKLLAVFIIVFMLVCTVGCDASTQNRSVDDAIENNNDYNYDYDDTDYNNYSPNVTSSVSSNTETNGASTHTHYYFSSITKEATCAENGVRTFKCSCGKSYTESIPKNTYHTWEYATCTSPKKCKVCGITEGDPLEHNYKSDGTCYSCGQENPIVSQTLASCSLELPVLPKSVSYYSYSGKLYSTVNVTNVTYKFECDNDGKISLNLFFSGDKTYDYRGSGQSDSCKIGWKLYGPNGTVVKSGTCYSPSVAIGESFADEEENAFYSFDNMKTGAYRLEISNVN